jgi:alkylation response protein AidB-like acyl-CoA dehydrogenase
VTLVDFALSEEQEQLRDVARDVLAHECPTDVVRKVMETESALDPALWRLFADQGWLGILIPESHGGAGLGLLDAAVLLWELGRVVAPGPFLISSIGAVVTLREGATAAQQRLWLPRLASGEAVATLAVAEPPEPRFDPAGIDACARREGRGWRLEGTKLFVESAQTADLILAAFRTPRARSRKRSEEIGLFAVPAQARGLKAQPLVSADETRRWCELRLRGVRLADDALLGSSGAGRATASRCGRALARALDACAIATAAESLGGAERAIEQSVEYVKAREQFGRPVGSFQAVQHMAAEAVAKLEPARSLLWYAAWAFDARPREAPLAAAMVKALACDVYRSVTRTAVEMHGGIGFTWEHDMHLYFKRALANACAFGDSDAQRARVAELARF